MTQFISSFVESQKNPAAGLPQGGKDCHSTQKLLQALTHVSEHSKGEVHVFETMGDAGCSCWVQAFYLLGRKATLQLHYSFSHFASCCCCSDKVPDSRSILSLFLHISFLSANPNYWNGKDISLLAIIISAWFGFGLEFFSSFFSSPSRPPAWFYCSLIKQF